MSRFSAVSLLSAAAVAAALLPTAASAAAPQIEVIHAPAASPIDLVGTLFSWGVRTKRGDALPTGASLVRARVTFTAGTTAGTVIPVTLKCPSAQKLVSLADLWAPKPLRLENFAFRYNDRATQVKMRFSARKVVSIDTTARAAALCFDAQRLTALRARQERDRVRRAARTRPEVRTAPRRTLCHDSYVQRKPGHLVIGNLFEGDPVRVLRRSASGHWSEILGLRAFDGIGWIRTQVLCH